jgi:hypothetical protein
MMNKKVQNLRWCWDQESDSLIAKMRENSDEVIYSQYSVEWKGNPDKWIAYFEGVEIGTGNLLHCLEICKNDHQQ